MHEAAGAQTERQKTSQSLRRRCRGAPSDPGKRVSREGSNLSRGCAWRRMQKLHHRGSNCNIVSRAFSTQGQNARGYFRRWTARAFFFFCARTPPPVRAHATPLSLAALDAASAPCLRYTCVPPPPRAPGAWLYPRPAECAPRALPSSRPHTHTHTHHMRPPTAPESRLPPSQLRTGPLFHTGRGVRAATGLSRTSRRPR